MTIQFTPLRLNDDRFQSVNLPDDFEFCFSNANGLDLLDALGIEDAYATQPWPIQCFRALVTVARRKRLGHISPEIPTTEDRKEGRLTVIDCGRREGYIERRLEELSNLLNRSIEAGATHMNWS